MEFLQNFHLFILFGKMLILLSFNLRVSSSFKFIKNAGTDFKSELLKSRYFSFFKFEKALGSGFMYLKIRLLSDS